MKHSVRTSLLSFAFVALLCAGCGGPLKYSIHGTPKAPDADAKIVADVDKDGGVTRLEINVEHLAPPERVTDGSSTYVVWARPDSSKQWTRVGALRYDTGDRVGTLLGASVPETAFDLVVTAEKDASPASPSPGIVFEQRVAR